MTVSQEKSALVNQNLYSGLYGSIAQRAECPTKREGTGFANLFAFPPSELQFPRLLFLTFGNSLVDQGSSWPPLLKGLTSDGAGAVRRFEPTTSSFLSGTELAGLCFHVSHNTELWMFSTEYPEFRILAYMEVTSNCQRDSNR